MKAKGFTSMEDVHELMDSLDEGDLNGVLPEYDIASDYAANQMPVLEKMKPSTAYTAAILTLVGMLGATTSHHGPEVQKYVDDKTFDLIRKQLASLRKFINNRESDAPVSRSETKVN